MKYTRYFECGCKVVVACEFGEPPLVANAKIHYCPKHKAAPDMYEALKVLLEWAKLSFSEDTGEWADVNDPAIIMAKQALAKAEGRRI